MNMDSIYARKRPYTASVYEGNKRSFFLSVNHRISPYTTRRYTVVIRDHVNRRISPYTIVYDRACSTWEIFELNVNNLLMDVFSIG